MHLLLSLEMFLLKLSTYIHSVLIADLQLKSFVRLCTACRIAPSVFLKLSVLFGHFKCELQFQGITGAIYGSHFKISLRLHALYELTKP